MDQRDQERIKDFFKETEKVPFDLLPTVLITGMAHFDEGTNVNPAALFEAIPVYEIPNWNRGKNKKVKIPHPGVPYTVLSVKYGRQIRGIVKNSKDLEIQSGNKGKFPNQICLDVALKDKIVNVMLFPNKMKITGSQKAEHLVETFIFIKAMLVTLYRQGLPVYAQSPILVKLAIHMENVVFDLGFKIRKDVLMQKAIEDGAMSPKETDAVRVLYPMGCEKTKGGQRYYNFRVLHTGKVVFSGNCRKDMKPQYEKFMDFISRNESDIRFV